MRKTESIVIYKGPKGDVKLQAQFENETVWATLNQIAALFGRDKSVISRHIRDILKNGELSQNRTVAKNATVQVEGNRKINRTLEVYNLDMILSVGYRVNSKQATAFRIWATETLRNYLIKGYVVNEKRLKESTQNSLKELEKAVAFIQSVSIRKELEQSEMQNLLHVVRDYANSWMLFEQYDKGTLQKNK